MNKLHNYNLWTTIPLYPLKGALLYSGLFYISLKRQGDQGDHAIIQTDQDLPIFKIWWSRFQRP